MPSRKVPALSIKSLSDCRLRPLRARPLAEKLKGLHAEVTVLDRDPEKLKLAHDRGFSCLTPDELKDPEILSPFAYLFNTIPCPVFSKIFSPCRPGDHHH